MVATHVRSPFICIRYIAKRDPDRAQLLYHGYYRRISHARAEKSFTIKCRKAKNLYKGIS